MHALRSSARRDVMYTSVENNTFPQYSNSEPIPLLMIYS